MKPSVCIDAVLEGASLDDALNTVQKAGITAFEFWAWWEKDIDALIAARDARSMQIACCCTRFISLVDPDTREAYLQGLEASIAAALKLNCPTLISQVGDFRPGVSRKEQHACLVAGLKAAAPLLETAGITLVIEPLNELVDHAGYYLTRSDEAFEIIDEVGSKQVQVVFDIYHQQITEGHLIHNITTNISKIGHFHAAGNPGRHELGNGEIDYRSVLDAIRKTGYDRYVGLEYWPLESPLVGLKQAAELF